MKELETMKKLKKHPHVIKLLGCVTESGMFWLCRFCFTIRIFLVNLPSKTISSISFASSFRKTLSSLFSEEPLVLIEYVPFGDLLGYLRKSRGLNDTYYKDPDIKPQTNLTSQHLMKFSWQIADGMSYLSSKSVSHKYERHKIIVKIPCGAYRHGKLFLHAYYLIS